ncbi:hypothetical protein T492DRAFT_594101, partial [Pavlovales sp. CCMP2436]
SRNKIGDVGAVGLGKALKANASLTTLNLAWNQIGDAGAVGLGKALEGNASLTMLNLGFNQLTDKAALALADVLKVNASLGSSSGTTRSATRARSGSARRSRSTRRVADHAPALLEQDRRCGRARPRQGARGQR